MKKILSLLLAVLCVFSAGTAAFAEGNIIVDVPENLESFEPEIKTDTAEDADESPRNEETENEVIPEAEEPEKTPELQQETKPQESPKPENTPEIEEKPSEEKDYISQSRAIIGANLNDEQIAAVYKIFGVNRGDVIELKLNNQEEREYLEDFVDSEKIGTRSISCVYVELLDKGAGMDVTTSNINWVTAEMYISALATAGITDAKIVVASPFEVSGTAALAGVYKAYEDMTGQEMNPLAKAVSTQELTITAALADEIGSMDSMSIVNELKMMLEETKLMSDEEIKAQISEITGRYKVNLNDNQLDMLISLCRSLEGLDGDALKLRVEEVQDTLKKVSGAKTKVIGFVDTVKKAVESVKSFFQKIGDIIGLNK